MSDLMNGRHARIPVPLSQILLPSSTAAHHFTGGRALYNKAQNPN
jgi:hypothetical protein